ncbi:hypothetical protein B566_EDAN014886 [Ephemera danica]|nr:hypothetical protein B566_EDAN014886 [Ephemera danica]
MDSAPLQAGCIEWIFYYSCLQVLTMSDGSFIFKLWQKPPVPVYLKVYIFNVTNPAEFLAGHEKLRLQEVGPYIYR